jgi:hypothetical protein
MLFAAFRPQEIKKVTASERSRISYFTAPPAATYAALRKESRMKSTEATVLDRKSGGSREICGAPRLPDKGLGFVSSHADSSAPEVQLSTIHGEFLYGHQYLNAFTG